jgi:hypothetical protein
VSDAGDCNRFTLSIPDATNLDARASRDGQRLCTYVKHVVTGCWLRGGAPPPPPPTSPAPTTEEPTTAPPAAATSAEETTTAAPEEPTTPAPTPDDSTTAPAPPPNDPPTTPEPTVEATTTPAPDVPPDPGPPPPVLFSAGQGLVGLYTPASLDLGNLVWRDTSDSGSNLDATISGSGIGLASEGPGHGAAATVSAVTGGVGTSVEWPAGSIPADFTICTLSRYTGGVDTEYQRILQTATPGVNWLHGHWAGHAGVAYYGNAFVTPVVGNNPASLAPTDWLIFCGQNAAPYQMYSMGRVVGNTGPGEPPGQGNLALGINPAGAGEHSPFAVAEVAVWNRGLSADELAQASAYYAAVLAGNDPQRP